MAPSPMKPSEAIRGVADDSQNRLVAHMVSQMETQPDLAPLKPFAAALKQLQQKLEASLKRREELFVPEMKAMSDRRAALVAAQRYYNTMHPQLVLRLGDAGLVETFFRSLRKSVAIEATELETAGLDLPEG